jgi:hypothetical protein
MINQAMNTRTPPDHAAACFLTPLNDEEFDEFRRSSIVSGMAESTMPEWLVA